MTEHFRNVRQLFTGCECSSFIGLSCELHELLLQCSSCYKKFTHALNLHSNTHTHPHPPPHTSPPHTHPPHPSHFTLSHPSSPTPSHFTPSHPPSPTPSHFTLSHPPSPTPSHFTLSHPPSPSLTFHHLLQTLPHDMDVMNIVELIYHVGIMVQVLVPLTRSPVCYGIDLRRLSGGKHTVIDPKLVAMATIYLAENAQNHLLNHLLYAVLCPIDVYMYIDGFQMSIKRPTSGGQTRAQEAAVQKIFHLERSSFFYLSALLVRTQRSAY